MKLNRRQFFKALAAGATVVAGELYWPGEKLISIPSGKVFPGEKLISIPSGKVFLGNEYFHLDPITKNITVNASAPPNKVSVLELHRWLQDKMDDYNNDDELNILDPTPSIRITDNIIRLENGYYVKNPQYLTEGSLEQGNEFWAGIKSVGQIDDDTIPLINGEPAVRPGHINQCVKAKRNEKIHTCTRTYGHTYSDFTVQVCDGITVSPLLEAPDLFWNNPHADPMYEVYKTYPFKYNHCTTKAMRKAVGIKI